MNEAFPPPGIPAPLQTPPANGASPRFVARANALEHEAIWRLGAEALELQGGPAAGPDMVLRFPYRDVTAVRLSFAPSRVDSARYRCDLSFRSGQRLAILSTHYAGFADFEDRAASYVPFIRALIGRVAAANPAARFLSGKNPAVFVAEHLFLLAMVFFLIVVLSSLDAWPFGDSAMAKLVIIGAMIPLAVVYTRKNWPRRFTPDAIPPDVLPPVTTS